MITKKQFHVYFSEQEREALKKALLKHVHFSGSDLVRWLVVEYAEGRLVDGKEVQAYLEGAGSRLAKVNQTMGETVEGYTNIVKMVELLVGEMKQMREEIIKLRAGKQVPVVRGDAGELSEPNLEVLRDLPRKAVRRRKK